MQGRIESIEREMGSEGQERAIERPYVTEEDIAEVVGMWTGIPVTRLKGDETMRLMQMEGFLHNRVIGQQEASLRQNPAGAATSLAKKVFGAL